MAKENNFFKSLKEGWASIKAGVEETQVKSLSQALEELKERIEKEPGRFQKKSDFDVRIEEIPTMVGKENFFFRSAQNILESYGFKIKNLYFDEPEKGKPIITAAVVIEITEITEKDLQQYIKGLLEENINGDE